MVNRKIGAIIQARMGSTRLPGKVLMPAKGQPLLLTMINRIRKSKFLDVIIIATSDRSEDDVIADFCRVHDVPCFRGSNQDVLSRYHGAAVEFDIDTVVRLTSDCPIMDPEVVDKTIAAYLKNHGEYDYVSNTTPNPANYPDGMDVEVFSKEALVRSHNEAKLPSEREHVTFYLWRTGLFRTLKVDTDIDLSMYRLTLDYQVDYDLLKNIINHFQDDDFTLSDVVAYLQKNPELTIAQQEIVRNASWNKAFNEDEIFEKKKREADPGEIALEIQKNYSRAQGPYVWDRDGNRYLDVGLLGHFHNRLGYSDPDVNKAIIKAAKAGTSTDARELSRVLCDLHRWAGRVGFTRSSQSALTSAFRIARDWTQRPLILHGVNPETDAHWPLPKLASKDLSGIVFFKDSDGSDFEATIALHKAQIAAVVLEIGNLTLTRAQNLERIRQIAEEQEILVIFDETRTGFISRLGGQHLALQVSPDIAIFSEALANGGSLAALLTTKRIEKSFSKISEPEPDHLAFAAAFSTIQKMIADKTPEDVQAKTRLFQSELTKIIQATSVDLELLCLPLCTKLTFLNDHGSKIALLSNEMVKRGFLLNDVTFFNQSHVQEHIIQLLSGLRETLASMATMYMNKSNEGVHHG